MELFTIRDFAFLIILLASLSYIFYTHKLTPAGTLSAGVLALIMYAGAGIPGVSLLAFFFITGTGVTLWGRKKKEERGLTKKDESTRTARQVWANGGVAGLLALMALIFPQQKDLFTVMIGGAFSAAAADTVSSELGVLYGKKFFNIRTFRRDEKGKDGVVSREGTLLGVCASLLIALIFYLTTGVGHFPAIIVGGTAGNLTDSFLGATLERKGLLSNNWVNAANTFAGALTVLLFV